MEGLDFEENFSPVARLEAIMIFLAFACYNDFKVYQMDMKYAFLNGDLEEEIYMEQPEGFSFLNKPNYVWKLKKERYGLKQAPQAWYSILDKYLQKQVFKRGVVDSNVYIKTGGDELLIIVVHVDDIMFGRNKHHLVKWFAEEMKTELEMSMIRELTFYLGLQILQNHGGTFISQDKYLRDMLK